MDIEKYVDPENKTHEKIVELIKNIPVRDAIYQAMKARDKAYVPYSNYAVGAALILPDGKAIKGCNVENASYGITNCAERTAFFKAVSEGYTEFKAIAIVGGPKDGEITDFAYPCGACRQVMREFCNPDEFIVIVAKSYSEYMIFLLEDLIPYSFGPDNLTVTQK